MRLYEIDRALEEVISRCLEHAEEHCGEIPEEDEELIDALEMAKTDKIEGIALYIKDLSSLADAIAEEEKKLYDRRKAVETKCERLKNFLQSYLSGDKFQTARVKVSYRVSQSVEVLVSAETLPIEYQRVKTHVEASKTAIAVALKAGVEIVGCNLVDKVTMAVK